MKKRIHFAAMGVAVGVAGLSFVPTSAEAQQIFCPPNASATNTLGGGNAPFQLNGGACTNGLQGSGAFSGAALASQALTDLTRTTTTETNRQTSAAVGNRREQEAARCPPGQVQTGAGCAPPARASRPTAAAAQMRPTKVTKMVKGKRVVTTVMRPVGIVRKDGGPAYVEPIPVLIAGPRYGSFITGFQDYERRTGTGGSAVFYDGTGNVGAGINGLQNGLNVLPVVLRQQSTTKTGGFVAGFDMTFRDNLAPGDGAIFGVLAGYTDTSIRINTQVFPVNAAALAPGAARTQVSVRGPSVGSYATYFNGPFSIDHTLKIDFFRLNESFAELAGFGGINGPVQANIAGTGSTSLSQVSSIANANYRFPFWTGVFIEPTVGYQYTASFYGGGANALNLRDGDLLRLQGGARLGFSDLNWFGLTNLFGIVRSTTSITALAYENVFINGGFIQAGAFGSNTQTLNDARKLRGQFILNSNYEFGNGFSLFTQSDVRTGRRYFATGSKIGVRYEW